MERFKFIKCFRKLRNGYHFRDEENSLIFGTNQASRNFTQAQSTFVFYLSADGNEIRQ